MKPVNIFIIFAMIMGSGWLWLADLFKCQNGFEKLTVVIIFGILTITSFVILLFYIPFIYWFAILIFWFGICGINHYKYL